MSYCEFCGSKLEEGGICNCPAAEQSRAMASAPPQPAAPQESAPGVIPPPQTVGSPPQPQPGAYPPPQAQGGYPPPPPPGYAPPPGYGQQPPPGYSPSPYGAQPGYYGAPPHAYQPPNQAYQAFGAVRNTLGSFLKDPYGMAAQGGSLSPSVAMILLGVQALAFFLMVLGFQAQTDFRGTDAAFWFKIIFLGVVGIALLYVCIFAVGKIAKITLEPKTLLSAQALSSLPLSVMYLLLGIFGLIFEGDVGVFILSLIRGLGVVASILLLEISLRAVVPAGVGNISRLVTLTCSYALTNALIILISSRMVSSTYPIFF